jgi:type I restriction enzyme S subunit
MPRLIELCELIVDCEHKTAPTQETGYPSIRTPNIGKGRLILDGVNRVSEETYQAWTQREVPKQGDLILAREAPIGNVAIITPGLTVCLGQRTVLIRADRRKLNPQYLTYLLLGDEIQGRIASMSNGATVHHLNMKDIRELDMPRIPEPTIQDRIAFILSVYDDLLENNTRRIKILEEMAQMLYREWFVNFRFPGHEKATMVESELGPIPEGFAAEPLEIVCRRITDGSHWSPKSADQGFPMASVKDMHTWGLNLDSCRKVSKEDFETLLRNDCKPLIGDVLIAKDGSYLKHCFWMQEPMEVVILSSIAILRPNERLFPSYLSLHLLDPQIKSRMAGYVSGVAIPRIVLKDFRRFKVLVPPNTVQVTFAKLVEPMLRLCWSLTKKNDNLRTTRDFLLPKLISGEIPVEAADHAAAELIEQSA